MMSQPVTQDHTELESATIERRAGVSRQEFVRDYLYPRRPVVLTDAMEGWEASSRWTPEFFNQHFAERQVVVGRGIKYYKTTVGDYIQYANKFAELQTGQESEEGPFYLRNVCVGKTFPELLGDFSVADFFTPNWLERWPLSKLFPLAASSSSELFIGPPGARVPRIHRDTHMTHSWLSQVAGEKIFWMVSPDEDELVYQNPANQDHSQVNSMKDPDLERFPLFARANVIRTVLKPGETILIPAGWWHCAESLTISISLSGNFVNDSNFKDFRETTVLPKFSAPGRFKSLMNWSVLQLHGMLSRMQDFQMRPRVAR